MITELLIGTFAWLFEQAIGLMPDGEAPGWVTSAASAVVSVLASGSGLGAWFPMGLLLTVVAVVLACVAIGFAIKVVRMVASYLTLGGGSAG